jgi:hypothetical protein
MATIDARPRTVEAEINYVGPMDSMPYFYAKDHERDNLVLESHRVEIADARALAEPPALEREGFTLVPHKTAVADFTDLAAVNAVYPAEIDALLMELTGADFVRTAGPVLRFSESIRPPGFVNSMPAGFAHVDVSKESFDAFARRAAAGHPDSEALLAGRYLSLNIWRVLTPPPQDLPLAVCAGSSVAPADRVVGEARVDGDGIDEFRFGSSLIRANPAHLWYYYRDMTPDEALIFKAFDSDEARVQGCPHTAFTDPSAQDPVPRASCEIRAFAFWRA